MNEKRIRVFVPGDVKAPAISVECINRTEKRLISGAIRMPRGEAWGVVRAGRVISWAVARLPDENGVRHITVETDREYRGNGYAAACVQAVVRAVREPLIYECEAGNLASARTALKAGLVEQPVPQR